MEVTVNYYFLQNFQKDWSHVPFELDEPHKHSVSEVQSATRNERTKRQRKHCKNRPNSTYMSDLVASSKLLEFNVAIDYNFCTDRLCVIDVDPGFTYRVLIRKYIPLEYVTLQFSPKSPSEADHCIHREKPIGCPSASMDSVPYLYHRPEKHSHIRNNQKLRITVESISRVIMFPEFWLKKRTLIHFVHFHREILDPHSWKINSSSIDNVTSEHGR
ncbi:uncharacterized protein LOC141855593 [Brevipalpus obovatus]|uniref:uncharacterized protein LOC141855593 n=1 Tax=Brevipalpus obovatus TaxID=246614 RepID=UPI003D9DFA46